MAATVVAGFLTACGGDDTANRDSGATGEPGDVDSSASTGDGGSCSLTLCAQPSDCKSSGLATMCFQGDLGSAIYNPGDGGEGYTLIAVGGGSGPAVGVTIPGEPKPGNYTNVTVGQLPPSVTGTNGTVCYSSGGADPAVWIMQQAAEGPADLEPLETPPIAAVGTFSLELTTASKVAGLDAGTGLLSGTVLYDVDGTLHLVCEAQPAPLGQEQKAKGTITVDAVF